jgi:hypothetical protein
MALAGSVLLAGVGSTWVFRLPSDAAPPVLVSQPAFQYRGDAAATLPVGPIADADPPAIVPRLLSQIEVSPSLAEGERPLVAAPRLPIMPRVPNGPVGGFRDATPYAVDFTDFPGDWNDFAKDSAGPLPFPE